MSVFYSPAEKIMAPQLLFDIDKIDLTQLTHDVDAINAINPQRGDMRQLDGIVYYDFDDATVVGFKDVKPDEFWVEGHVPGRPLYPGVLMIEAAAQLAGFLMKLHTPSVGFLGFVGCERVRFRGQVVPGDRMYLLGKEQKKSTRRFTCNTQGIVNGKLVFEAQVQGMSF